MNLVLLLLLALADLSSIKAVPDPEKRSDLALSNADREIDVARDSYKAGKSMQESLDAIGESVRLAAESLEQAPQQARKSKYFKRAELKTQTLLRRLGTLADEVSVDDRKPVEDVRHQVQEVHDHLLGDIMGNKKHAK